ncbi:Methyltransferase type 11 [Desulfurispirillum indicum S5]|uniref:Methyltransferase type 11 n=1 Tax=Desulfurispirillum indicum (strain ATCC BAA-1389 / DSM 22839 / S5) TaxID=653733 RepID=E6W6Z8_DESIS|nr:class I SAM-dependent methyltransferase [Desulfurispirillum indicum]ADU65076.1 Methyltransferase type 11 [Desulfurispirillum indicum S5]
MKVRDSGMPEEMLWESFFDAERILQSLGLNKDTQDIVEFGSGYGTFTLAAAALIHGTVYALDIEPSMVQRVKEKCARSNIANVHVQVRDFIVEGTGLPPGSMDVALLFNILHHEQPLTLLREASSALVRGGRIAIIHWNPDPATPRGPAMDIRPTPQQCIQWGKQAGLECSPGTVFDFPPYHYGLILRKA